MLPLVYIFGLKISTYWLAMLAGFVSMMILMLSRRRLFQLKIIQAVILSILLMMAGLLGGKILYTLENMNEILQSGVSFGGFSFFGSVFLIPIFMNAIKKVFFLNSSQMLDVCAPCVALMISIIRFGCFLNGCCGGVYIKGYLFRWPTQAIESIFDILILLKLLSLENEKKMRGNLYALFMIYYGCVRFLIEFLRDTAKECFGFSHGQVFAIISIIIGWVYAFYKNKKCIIRNDG